MNKEETEHLQSSEANKKRLEESINQLNKEERIKELRWEYCGTWENSNNVNESLLYQLYNADSNTFDFIVQYVFFLQDKVLELEEENERLREGIREHKRLYTGFAGEEYKMFRESINKLIEPPKN